ncbi:MAG: glycosyltransferase family 39 protein [Deltaproteobacteria bacterium]|nr:glycosyltransferase family 39 protein [Deltaproteobacteria bacterium]
MKLLKNFGPLAIVAAVIAGSMLAVGRLPGVPLDDSWNFVLPLKHFLETGVPVFDSFNSAAAVLHLLAAWPFAKVFGLSFELTVAVNLLVSVATVFVVYRLAREAGQGQAASAMLALAFWAAPPVFVTAYTFQSDPIFVLVMAAALVGFARFARTYDRRALMVGSLLAALSIWGKMHGVLIAPAMVAAIVVDRRLRQRATAGDAAWLVLPTAVSYLAFKLAQPTVHPVRITLERKFGEFHDRLISPMVWIEDGSWRTAAAIVSIGFYLLPFAAALFFTPGWRKRLTRMRAFGAGVIGLGLSLGIWSAIWFMDAPWAEYASVILEPPSMAPFGPWVGVLALGFGGLPLLAVVLVGGSSEDDPGHERAARRSQAIVAAFVLAGQTALMIPILLYMDRYFLVLLPPAILLVAALAPRGKPRWWIFIPILIAILAFDVVRVRQYRNGAEAQWEAADELVASGVPPLQIDGGYAWFGWHNFENCPVTGGEGQPTSAWVRELCPSASPDYQVTFYPPGAGQRWKLERPIPYESEGLPGAREGYVQRREPVE